MKSRGARLAALLPAAMISWSRTEAAPLPLPLPAEGDTTLTGLRNHLATATDSEAWRRLRTLWSDLTTHTQSGGEWYVEASIDWEKAESYRDMIGEIFMGLRDSSPLAGHEELAILERLLLARLDFLQYGSRSMMTRMMPPAIDRDLEDAMMLFEQRLDILEDLRSTRAIAPAEYLHAMHAVLEGAATAVMLDTLAGRRNYFWGYHETGEEQWALVQMRMEELRRFCSDPDSLYLYDLEDAGTLMAGAAGVLEHLPGLSVLVAELVTNP